MRGLPAWRTPRPVRGGAGLPAVVALLSALLLCLPAAGAAARELATYQHASGISFSYPQGWTLREDEEGLYLIPDGVQTAANGMPKEYLFFSSTPAPDITTAGDPVVAAYFEKMLAEQAPGRRG